MIEMLIKHCHDGNLSSNLTAESPDFEQARKALQNAGFNLTPGVTTAITKD